MKAPPGPPTRSGAVNIDRLVLHGFPRHARHSIGSAIQGELGALIRARGVPDRLSRPARISEVDAGAMTISRRSPPDVVGRRIALRIYEQLGE